MSKTVLDLSKDKAKVNIENILRTGLMMSDDTVVVKLQKKKIIHECFVHPIFLSFDFLVLLVTLVA